MNYTTIVSMIMKNESLQIVLDTMAEYIQASLIIIGEDMEIIAFSKTVPNRDPYWTQILKEGHVSHNIKSMIYQDPFMMTLFPTSKIMSGFSYLPDNTTLKYHITFPRDSYRYTITFIASPLTDSFDRHHIDLMHSFAYFVKNTYLYSQSLPLAYSYRGQKSILQKLLNLNYAHSQEIEIDKNEVTDDSIFEDIQVLIFSPEYQKVTDTILHSYADNISSIIGNDYATVYESSIVTIFHSNQMPDSYMEQLIHLASNVNAKIGISWKFSGATQVYKQYKQTIVSIDKARKLSLPGYIFTCEDMFIYTLLDHCHKRDHWSETEHPVLTKLKQYDATHDSALYITVYYFLKSGMNSSLTAKNLGIHKSTLYHRLEIIKEIIPDLLTENALWHTSLLLAFNLSEINHNHI